MQEKFKIGDTVYIRSGSFEYPWLSYIHEEKKYEDVHIQTGSEIYIEDKVIDILPNNCLVLEHANAEIFKGKYCVTVDISKHEIFECQTYAHLYILTKEEKEKEENALIL